jgi:ribonuclease BN (tRNA processing enzyme)
MKLRFLGTGSAFTVGTKNFQSNMLLESTNGKCLLIDCGSDVRHSLFEQGHTHRDIDAVFISHLHSDHVGGLEWLAFSTKFDSKSKKPTLFAADILIEDLWEKTLAGGLSSLPNTIPTLATYFKLYPVKTNTVFHWQKNTFHLIKTLHAMNGLVPMPCYALKFKANKVNVLLTGDLQYTPKLMMPYYLEADIIFHDCETAKKKSGVHPAYQDLLTLPLAIRKKMWLYDYNDEKLPAVKQHGFRGLIKKGQLFDFNKKATLY